MRTDTPGYRRQAIALVIVLVLFVAGIYRCQVVEQKLQAQEQPSTFAYTKPGAGAFYKLLQALGYPVERYTNSWAHLGNSKGILIVLEPVNRPPTEDENAPLRDWIAGGGTLFLVCAGDPQGLDPKDAVAGDVSLIRADTTVSHPVPVSDSQYTQGVANISVSSPLRLVPKPGVPYHILFKDTQGVIAAEKRLGSGHVILMVNDLIATNSGISQNDNSLFLVNVATIGAHGAQVAFDEYHHGLGLESGGPNGTMTLWHRIPGAIQWSMIDLFAIGVVLVYNGNKNTGPRRRLARPALRSNSDYVSSMARLYRRAGARDVALDTVYGALMRDLRRQLGARPDAPPRELIALCYANFGTTSVRLESIVERCEHSGAGLAIRESELVALIMEIDAFRRDVDIVGYQ